MKESNLEIDATRIQFDRWIEKNRNQLPLNFDSWDVQIIENQQQQINQAGIELGKYHSSNVKFSPFYKPISRIVELTLQNEK
jgi:hypothetical protein